jgi:hypothetical protein
MLKKGTILMAAACIAGALSAAPADAQVRTVYFGVAGGPTFASSGFTPAVNTGWHVKGTISFPANVLPFAVEGGLLYNQHPVADPHTGNHSLLAGLVNGVFGLPAGIPLRPYVTAGVGVYNGGRGGVEGQDAVRDTHFGLNGGGGLQFGLGGMTAFLEARFHNVMASDEAIRFIPLSVGVMF